MQSVEAYGIDPTECLGHEESEGHLTIDSGVLKSWKMPLQSLHQRICNLLLLGFILLPGESLHERLSDLVLHQKIFLYTPTIDIQTLLSCLDCTVLLFIQESATG